MQHYGYPTRLLDVTDNYFKAIAFMVDGYKLKEKNDMPPCIYIFEPKNECSTIYMEEEKIYSTEELNQKNFSLIVPPNNQKKNIRLHAQSGLFIYYDIEGEEDIIIELEKKYIVSKLVVKLDKPEDIETLEQKLDEYKYGISTLYPDMIKRSEYYKKYWNKS